MTHTYATHLIWHGNRGDGTASYAEYGREYRVLVAGKPALTGSADAAFRGDPALHNPEDLFVASSPVVTIAEGSDETHALELHDTAHARCFIANSVRIPVRHEATVRVASGSIS